MTITTPNKAGALADLVRRILAGDRQAEDELVERYSRGVEIIIRRLAGDGAIDDLYQETFRIVLEKLRKGALREPEKLSGFVCGVARNLVIEHFRQIRRQESLSESEEAAVLLPTMPDQLTELLRKERAAHVRQILSEMRNERDAQVLFRFYIAEDEKERICADLELSSLHFNRVLHRARARYRELYQVYGEIPGKLDAL